MKKSEKLAKKFYRQNKVKKHILVGEQQFDEVQNQINKQMKTCHKGQTFKQNLKRDRLE